MADELPKDEKPRLSLFRDTPKSIKTLRRLFRNRLERLSNLLSGDSALR
jgi:hypothetical protein